VRFGVSAVAEHAPDAGAGKILTFGKAIHDFAATRTPDVQSVQGRLFQRLLVSDPGVAEFAFKSEQRKTVKLPPLSIFSFEATQQRDGNAEFSCKRTLRQLVPSPKNTDFTTAQDPSHFYIIKAVRLAFLRKQTKWRNTQSR
jgi:hypothetical protein